MAGLLSQYLTDDKLHHAYLLVGLASALRPELLAFVEKDLGRPVEGHPDVWIYEAESFGIDDGRELRERQQGRPVVHARRYFIVSVGHMTEEAQNALLKTLEEPIAGVHIFLIARSADTFLPTVRSRCFIIQTGASNNSGTEELAWAQEFLAGKPAERITMIGELVVREKDDDLLGKTLYQDRLTVLERLLRERYQPTDPNFISLFEALGKARSYLADRASSPRLLFEQLAFLIP